MLFYFLVTFLLLGINASRQPFGPTFSLLNINFFYDVTSDSYLMGLTETQSQELYIFHHDGTIRPASDYPNVVELQVNWPMKDLGLISVLKILKHHYYHLDWSSFMSVAMKMDMDSLRLLPADFWNTISSQSCVELIMKFEEKQLQLNFIKFLDSIGVQITRFSLSSSIEGICYGASEGDIVFNDDRTMVITMGGGMFITHYAWKTMKIHKKYFEEYERIEAKTPLFLYSDAQ